MSRFCDSYCDASGEHLYSIANLIYNRASPPGISYRLPCCPPPPGLPLSCPAAMGGLHPQLVHQYGACDKLVPLSDIKEMLRRMVKAKRLKNKHRKLILEAMRREAFHC